MKHHVPLVFLGSQGWEGPAPPGCTEGKQAHQGSPLQFLLRVLYTGTLCLRGNVLNSLVLLFGLRKAGCQESWGTHHITGWVPFLTREAPAVGSLSVEVTTIKVWVSVSGVSRPCTTKNTVVELFH